MPSRFQSILRHQPGGVNFSLPSVVFSRVVNTIPFRCTGQFVMREGQVKIIIWLAIISTLF